MPAFETIPLHEATLKTSTGRRAQLAQEYLQSIQQLAEGQAGKLQASEGEKISTVRRRLGEAGRLAGKNLVIKRTGKDLYFWVASTDEQRSIRRGRRPRTVQEDDVGDLTPLNSPIRTTVVMRGRGCGQPPLGSFWHGIARHAHYCFIVSRRLADLNSA